MLTRKPVKVSHSAVLARWQSGYAEDCKSLYVGSIPARASSFLVQIYALSQSLAPFLRLVCLFLCMDERSRKKGMEKCL